MRRFSEISTGCALMLTYAGFAAWLFCLSVIQNGCTTMSLRLWPLLLYLPAVYCADYALTHAGTGLSVYVALQLFFAGLGGGLFALCANLEPGGMGTRILLGIIYGCGALAGGFAGAEEPRKDLPGTCFDFLLVMAVLLLLLDRFILLPARNTALLALSVAGAAALLALVSVRAAKEGTNAAVSGSALGGRVMMIALGAAVLGLALLCAMLAAGGLRSVSALCLRVLGFCLGWAKEAGKALFRLLYVLVEWLTRFAKDPGPVEALPMPETAADVDIAAEMGEASLPAWIGWTLGAIAAAVVLVFLFRMRREHIGREKTVLRRRRGRLARRESGWKEALKMQLEKLIRSLRRRVLRFNRRKSAAGLLAWCESRVPRQSRRRPDESGPAFLRRLAEAEGRPEDEAQALRSLAGLAEQTFYSAAAPELPKGLYRAVKRCKFT